MISFAKSRILCATLFFFCAACPAFGFEAFGGRSATADRPGIEVAFSPGAGAEALVLKVIGSAKQSIRLAAYSFTSAPVARALVDAKKRGVEVGVIVDYKHNILEDRSGKAKAALNLLTTAGIPTRVISRYAIHHDKYIVVDGSTVETGSFNFSAAAAKSNSENVIVLWAQPQVAREYLAHWQSRYDAGTEFVPGY